jgi:broad specificity phosphatase PhoE
MIASLLFATLLSSSPTTVYLVRHAEKVVEPKNDDPDLTDRGKKRAAQLERVLRAAKITAIHSTDYKRTKLTVEPLAKTLGVPVESISTKTPDAVKHLLEKHAGQTVLYTGHSNTLPDMIAALGVKEKVTMTDADYDRLYIVIRDGTAEPVLIALHYGD